MMRDGAGGAFWTGALTAFIATPCSGPFMGLAIGAALVLPAPAALAVFIGLGLGLALPFLAIGTIPALRSRLPTPGPWMARLRSEEHTSELQSLMRISYAVFCLKKKKKKTFTTYIAKRIKERYQQSKCTTQNVYSHT